LWPGRAAPAGTLPVREPAPDAAGPAWRRRLARYAAVIRVARYALAFVALALNLYSTDLLRHQSYVSLTGGVGWAISLLLLLLAFVGHRAHAHQSADAGLVEVEDRTDLAIPRLLEIAIFLAIFLLALGLRLYRLDDWQTGMHGDEGEAGMDAISILEGNLVSPFRTGWFSQPNFYYWGIALTMKVFGTGMLGLRMFSTLAGTLMILPFYPLVRQWFGVRTAIIASIFLAISDVAIHFSRQEFSNMTTPFFLVTGFFFFFRGLKSRRLLNFVLAGYAHILSMYFYLGGRLTPILVVAFMAYLFILMPLVRVPGVYRNIRRHGPAVSRVRALGRALRTQFRSVLLYASAIVVYTLACICFISPWLAYFVDNSAEWNARANDKLIFNNVDRMAGQYGVNHTPLYIGLRLPGPQDTLPLPVVFEQTPASLLLSKDGFWPRVLWGQLTTTLSILTYRGDASSVYTFTQEPVAKPFEAVLIILGIAWALWRWRDTRMALLSMWFWSTVLVGGMLTIDAPYMARLIGIIPTLAVFAAIPLNKLVAEFVQVLSRFGQSVTLRRTALAVSTAGLCAVMGSLGLINYHDYYDRYLAQIPLPFSEVTGQAYFVRQMNDQVLKEGSKLVPRYYDLGAHLIYWGHGDNRFLNHGTPGSDMVNSSNALPIIDNEGRDAVFMVWDPDQQYLSVLHAYYPEGQEQQFTYGPNNNGPRLFTWYRVTSAQIDARRVLQATYTPAQGPAIQQTEPNLGTGGSPPAGLSYPVQARWAGSLVAPAFGRYRFHLDAPAAAHLVIDGISVLTGTAKTPAPDAEVILARGPHAVELTGTLPAADARVSLGWAIAGQALVPVPRKYLWSGPGTTLLGEVRPLVGDPWGPIPSDAPGGGSPVIMRRIDGFLGFRDAPNALSGGAPLMAVWSGTLLAPQTGLYAFDVFSNGGSMVTIDGQMVVDNRQNDFNAHNANGQVNLTAGPHRFELRYAWAGNVGYLEAYWTPPGGAHTMLGPTALQADAGIWQPGKVTEPGNVQAQLGNEPSVTPPDRVLDARSNLKHPRGMALDAVGHFYIADGENHRVVVLNPDGSLARTWGQQGKGNGDFETPEDVAIGPDGKIYVLDSGLGRVQVFSPDGQFDHAFGGLCTPAGFTVGADGFVYIAETCANRIDKYSAAGELRAQYAGGADPTSHLDQPVDVVVDKDETLYVVDLRQRIVRLDPTKDAITKTWPVQVGTNLGAGNLAQAGTVLYLTDPDHMELTSVDTATGRIDHTGKAGDAPGQFNLPTGVAVDAGGHVYVLDAELGRIQVFTLGAGK